MIKHNTMTLGEVIDNLKLGEVAIQVDGDTFESNEDNALFIEPIDHRLRTYPNEYSVDIIFAISEKEEGSKYIILPKENADKFIFNR